MKKYRIQTRDTSEACKGRIPWNKGVKLGKEYEHMGFQKGHPLYFSFEGKLHTEESKKKMRLALKGRVPWNRGLTKDDERVKRHVEKSGRTLKKMYGKGELEAWNKGKKVSGMSGHHHSEESKRKIRSSNKEFFKEHPEKHGIKIMLRKAKEMGYEHYPSRGQRQLFKLLKTVYSDAELELPIKTKQSVRYCDIGVKSEMIDFEYDGEGFWHDEESDKQRDEELSDVGWTTIRVDKHLLNELKDCDDLKSRVDDLVELSCVYSEVSLD